MILNALSVDVEEYFHAAIFRKATAASGERFESRLERSMDRLLALLDARGARATFFALGEVAVTHPAVVRRIAAEGHEVACHGDRHEDVHRQSPQEFRADVRRAARAIDQTRRSDELAGMTANGVEAFARR